MPSLGATADGRALVGVCGTSDLDAFRVKPSGELEDIGPLSLDFVQFCFTVGHSNGLSLLFATARGERSVRLLLLPDDSDSDARLKEADQLRRMAGICFVHQKIIIECS